MITGRPPAGQGPLGPMHSASACRHWLATRIGEGQDATSHLRSLAELLPDTPERVTAADTEAGQVADTVTATGDAIAAPHAFPGLASWGYRHHVTLARVRSLGLYAGLVLATLVVGHHLIYAFAHGAEHDHIRATSAAGHDQYWLLFLVAVVGAAIGIMVLAAHELRRLARLAASTPRGAIVQDADVRHLLGAWLPLFAKIGVAAVLAFLVQENLELLSVGAGFPGIGVLTGDHGVAIPVLLVVAAVIALLGALVRWRRDILLARIRRALPPPPGATPVWFVAPLPLVCADGRGSNGTRAPPLMGAAPS